MADAGSAAGGSTNWGAIAGAAASIGSNIFGALSSSAASDASVKLAKKIYKEQRADFQTAQTNATADVAPDANQDAADNYVRNAMVSDPSQLTPSQQIGLQDLTRQGVNNLDAEGLAGSGRAGASVLADATNRYLAGAYDTNKSASDNAASTLSARGANARQSLANIQMGTGSNLANAAGTMGSTVEGLQVAQGDNLANAITASGNVLGSTLGAINGSTGDERSYNKYASPGSSVYFG